jgi:hypothetical protein
MIASHFVLHGCKTWSTTLMEFVRHIFQNSVLRKMSEDIESNRRLKKFNNVERPILYSSALTY